MRIGFDAKRLFFNQTGLGNYSRSLLRHLSLAHPKHDYLLFTPKPAPPTASFFQHAPFQTVTGRSPHAWWRSFGQVKQWHSENLDLYHGLSNELPVGSRRSGIPTIVTIHDLIFKSFPETYPFIDRQIYDWKFRRSCQEATRILAISQATKADLVDWYQIAPEKIEVIYQPLADHYYQPLSPELVTERLRKYRLPPNFLLSVGTIEPRKNLQLIIEALAILPRHCRLPLVIVGRPTRYKQKVVERARKLRVDDSLIWLDWLTDYQDLQALYQAATVFIYPSKCEGFGLPVVEAQLSGTSVITSQVSSLPEAGGTHAHQIDPDAPDELAQCLFDLLGDPEASEQLAEAGQKEAAERFDPQLLTQQLYGFYQQVVQPA